MLSYLSSYIWTSDAEGNSNPTDNAEITDAHVGETKKNLCSAETAWVLVNRDGKLRFLYLKLLSLFLNISLYLK